MLEWAKAGGVGGCALQEIISDYEGPADAAHAPFRPVHRPQRFCHPLPDQLIAPPARGPLKSGQRNGRGRCTDPSTKSVRPLLELPEEQQDGGASLYVSDDSGTFDRAGHDFKGLSGNLSGGWRSAADGQKSRENSGIRDRQRAIKAPRPACSAANSPSHGRPCRSALVATKAAVQVADCFAMDARL